VSITQSDDGGTGVRIPAEAKSCLSQGSGPILKSTYNHTEWLSGPRVDMATRN